MADADQIINRIFEFLSDKPRTVQQIVIGTKLHGRTVRKYLKLIENVQSFPKVKKSIQGARVVYTK